MIAPETIDKISELLAEQGLDEAAVSSLRTMWPDIHFTYCSDDDVCGPAPAKETEEFSVYLIDSRNHCLSFTSDTEVATGLVLAQHETDF